MSYGRLGTVTGLCEKLREVGVTHILYGSEAGQLDSIAGEALFRALTLKLANPKPVGPWSIGALPEQCPASTLSGILYVGCTGLYKNGLYTVDALAQPVPDWPTQFPEARPSAEAPDWRVLLPHASAVVIEDRCEPATSPSPDFVVNGVQRAPMRAWRHFTRTTGTPLPF